MKTALKTLGVALAAGASSLLVGSSAQAASLASSASLTPIASNTFNNMFVEILSNTCISNTCEHLGTVYDVTGGHVFNPAQNLKNTALTPGSDTLTSFDPFDDSDSVRSYNITSKKTNPGDIETPIKVSNLKGGFEFFWGSVDNHNTIEFYNTSNTLLGTVTGSDIANLLGIPLHNSSNIGNYMFDAYVRISHRDLAGANLFTTSHRTAGVGNGISFEVAVATVPEPVSVVSFLAVGLVAGGSMLKRKLEA